jgi:hypothetical protein
MNNIEKNFSNNNKDLRNEALEEINEDKQP